MKLMQHGSVTERQDPIATVYPQTTPKTVRKGKVCAAATRCGSWLPPFGLIDDWTITIGCGPRICRSTRTFDIIVRELARGDAPVVNDSDLEPKVRAGDHDLHAL